MCYKYIMIYDEENFENDIQAKSTQSPTTKKGTHPTNPINPHLNPSNKLNNEPSPSKVISNPLIEEKKERDKINNLAQKEKKLEEAGVTRRKAYQVIREALDAVIVETRRDAEGNEYTHTRPDLDKQKWGCEMTLKAFGDLIERKEVEYDIGDKTLERFKSMSVAELKAKAADILLGKNTNRITDAEVVNE